MAKRRLVWALEAQGDFKDIIAFVAADSQVNARRVAERIDRAASGLRQLPSRGRRLPPLPAAVSVELRELIVEPWLLLYRVEKDAVTVLGLVDGRRDVVAWLDREQFRFPTGEP